MMGHGASKHPWNFGYQYLDLKLVLPHRLSYCLHYRHRHSYASMELRAMWSNTTLLVSTSMRPINYTQKFKTCDSVCQERAVCNWQRDHNKPGVVYSDHQLSSIGKWKVMDSYVFDIWAQAFDDDLVRNYNLLCEFMVETRSILANSQLPYVKDIEVP